MFINAGPLFGRAKAAYERAKEKSPSDRELGQMDALEAIVFSVFALEGFMNEAVDIAAQPSPDGSLIPATVSSFVDLAKEIKLSESGLQLKFMLAHYVFTGAPYATGRLPYQDFVLLIGLRNAIVHYKPQDSFSIKDGAPIYSPPPLLEKLRAKNITAKVEPSTLTSWLTVIATVAVARWSCKCAAAMVKSILDILPESHFKFQMEFFYRRPFQVPK